MVLSQLETGSLPGRIQHWIRLVVVLLVFVAATARAATFSVSLDHDTILLGDGATLSLKFEDGQPQGTPQLPEITGLQITYIGPSSSFSFVNGKTSSTVTHSYLVKPTQVGEFTIPALSVKLGGETLTSQAVKFKVVRPAAPEPGSEAEQQSLALLRLVLPKKEIFAGETVVIEEQLLVRSGVQKIANLELPELQIPGCTTAKPVQGQNRQTVIGSTSFALIPFYVPVTAMKSGAIKVGPIDGAVVVLLPSRQRDVFDPFGMFSGVQQRVAISAPEQTLTVLPLPESGKPAHFTGAVGSYQMTFSASPTNVAVGDPITLRVEITGRGALDAFTLSEQGWKDFKAYPPTTKVETTGDLGLEGKKIFEQVVVPQNTEIKEVPDFEFSYFDPEKRSYQTLRHAPTPIIVRPGGSTTAPAFAISSNSPQNEKSSQDIVHIKPRLGKVGAMPTAWVTQPAFLALQGVPVLALLGAMFWRRRSDSLANNPRLRRQRAVAQIVREGLAQLRTLAADQNSDAFFATVFRLLQEQIGERLDLPASAITEAIIDDKLRARGLDPGAADSLHELFQQCNQARYAPVQSAQALEAVIPKLETILNRLQEVKG